MPSGASRAGLDTFENTDSKPAVLNIFFVYFQFSVSQFTWQIWNTNNSIKKIKQIESWRKHRCCAWVQKELVFTEAQTHSPGHGTVYGCSEPSVTPLSYPVAPSKPAVTFLERREGNPHGGHEGSRGSHQHDAQQRRERGRRHQRIIFQILFFSISPKRILQSVWQVSRAHPESCSKLGRRSRWIVS